MDIATVKTAARMLHDAHRIVVFTGAGISTESGIPDFRSPGGIWSQYNQDELTYQKFRSHERYRKLYWEYDRARYPPMRDAIPNPAHEAIAEMEKTGRLLALITQNIDGLHRKAGNSPERLFELHGNVREVNCLDCHARWPREEITDKMDREGIEVPYCPHCGGPLKCATIAFGQPLPAEVLENAFTRARLRPVPDCRVVAGSSTRVLLAPGSKERRSAPRSHQPRGHAVRSVHGRRFDRQSRAHNGQAHGGISLPGIEDTPQLVRDDSYLFENWKLALAARFPYFFRSLTRESLVRNPAALSVDRYPGSTLRSALLIPCLIAPA